jgi:Mrp family chromosome partitioning ATPase
MGSDNLNRVFIKAYSKGGANAAGSGNEAPANQEPLMVRFDTATVAIPAPHMLSRPRQPARSVTAPVSVPQLTQHARAVVTTAEMTAGAAQEPEPELTQWDETMMSILFGGSTMVAPNTSINSARRQPLHSQHSPSEPNSKPAQQVPNQNPGDPLVPGAVEVKTVPSTPIPTVANGHVVAGPTPAKPTSAESGLPVQNSVKSDVQQKVSALNQGGEIFRLDRPSYADTSARNSVDVVHSDADESSLTAIDIELQRTMEQGSTLPPSSPTANRTFAPVAPHTEPIRNNRSRTMENTKRREQGLRQSRIKIFNPLWEVDRLEWPTVCSELSRTIDESSSAVVNNLLRASQAGLQVLAVTSPQSGEGTSTVACCLAMLAGKHGMNIALVDSNIENPSLSYQTNLDLEVDWNDAVSKRMPLEEIAVHSVDDQVTLVPLLERLNSPELNEQNLAMMLQELSLSFDLVIVDLGHMSAQRNLVRKLGELGVINAVVAVVDRRHSTPERIEACLRQIRQTGISSIGLVENFAA